MTINFSDVLHRIDVLFSKGDNFINKGDWILIGSNPHYKLYYLLNANGVKTDKYAHKVVDTTGKIVEESPVLAYGYDISYDYFGKDQPVVPSVIKKLCNKYGFDFKSIGEKLSSEDSPSWMKRFNSQATKDPKLIYGDIPNNFSNVLDNLSNSEDFSKSDNVIMYAVKVNGGFVGKLHGKTYELAKDWYDPKYEGNQPTFWRVEDDARYYAKIYKGSVVKVKLSIEVLP